MGGNRSRVEDDELIVAEDHGEWQEGQQIGEHDQEEGEGISLLVSAFQAANITHSRAGGSRRRF
jgi:hypothetical protein